MSDAATTPVIAPEIITDTAAGTVEEKFADGTVKDEKLDDFLAEQVADGRAHDTNEARVQIGLAQIATLPASPDSGGNPTFTTGTAATSAPVATANTPTTTVALKHSHVDVIEAFAHKVRNGTATFLHELIAELKKIV